jgi:hypothetical protein
MKHGHARRGAESPTFRTWESMLWRCQTKYGDAWKKYGARNIKVCERWHSFENFLADMGERPHGTTLDRKDNNGHYKPGNCRWATRHEQAQNTRRNIYVEYHGEHLAVAEACRRAGVRRGLVMRRIELGWEPQRAFAVPAGKPGLHHV